MRESTSPTVNTLAGARLRRPPAALQAERERAYALADVRDALATWRRIGASEGKGVMRVTQEEATGH